MRRGSFTPPTIDELDCLVMWPVGTRGEAEERALIKALLVLCQQHGFGRVPQVAKQIEEIWHDPQAVQIYTKVQRDFRNMMADAKNLS